MPAIGSNGQPQVSGFTKDGHYRDDVQSLVVVDTFAADGVNAEASVLIMDTIYTYEAGKGLNEEFRTDYFNHSDNGIGTSIITNGLVQDAVSGNFSGNEEGKEQIVFTTCQKRASHNQYFYKTYTHTKRPVNLSGSVIQQDIVLVRKEMRTPLYVHQILTQTVRSQELKMYL